VNNGQFTVAGTDNEHMKIDKYNSFVIKQFCLGEHADDVSWTTLECEATRLLWDHPGLENINRGVVFLTGLADMTYAVVCKLTVLVQVAAEAKRA